jgi:uncharacterized membrane protein HdeD (DUF308 family)
MTFKQAYLAAIQDPISSVMAVVGRSYRYKTILVPACLIGVVGFLLSVCFTITALGVRNNAWQLLFQGTVGCLVGGNLALMCAAFARQSPDKVKSWLQ